MKRVVIAIVLLFATLQLHANCRSSTPPSQYAVAFTGPECTSDAPCVKGSSIHFSIQPAKGCYIPFYPGPCPEPYIIDACDTLTWDFGDGTAPVSVSGSGEVDHVFARTGSLTVDATIANGGGSTTIHGSAYICANPPSVVHFTKARYDVSEAAGTLTITLVRSGDTTRPLTLSYITTPGMTTGQYVRSFEVVNDPITFAAGETTKQVVHHIKDDHVFLGDFEYSVGVTSDGDAVLGAGPVETAVVAIADDEAGPELALDDVSVPEGNGEHAIDIPVHLSAPAGDNVYAWCVPHDGTARANVDFRLLGSTAAFEPGQTTSKCQIQLLGNFAADGNRTFTVTVDPVIGPVKVVRNTATVTIVDDEVAAPPTPEPPPLPTPLAVWFDAPSIHIDAGGNAAVPIGANSSANVALTSSDPSVVDVTSSAAVPGTVKFYALKPGTATVTATGGGATATIAVEVAAPSLALWFDVPSMQLTAGADATLPLRASLGTTVALTSSDASIIGVTSSATAPGTIRLYARKAGTATVTATSGAATAKITVEVTPPPKRRASR